MLLGPKLDRILLVGFVGANGAIKREISEVELIKDSCLNESDGGYLLLRCGIGQGIGEDGLGNQANGQRKQEEAEFHKGY